MGSRDLWCGLKQPKWRRRFEIEVNRPLGPLGRHKSPPNNSLCCPHRSWACILLDPHEPRPERVDPSVASGARDEGSHLEVAGADREVEVSFNVLTRSGGVKRIGSMGVKRTADQRMERSRVGSKCCGVGWVRRKTTRHGTAKLTHGRAPCRFSALFASRGFFRRVLSSTHLSKERPLNGLSKMSRLNRMSIASRGLNWIRSLRRAPGDASARPAPVREAVPQNRRAKGRLARFRLVRLIRRWLLVWV